MSVPGSVESGASPNLFSSLRLFWSVVVSILSTRLDLLTAELEEEAKRAVQLLLMGLAALLCIGMTVFFTMFFLVVLFWDHATLVLGIICGVSLLMSVGLLFATRYMIQMRPKFLSQTLNELHRDVESLRSSPAAKSEEAKP